MSEAATENLAPSEVVTENKPEQASTGFMSRIKNALGTSEDAGEGKTAPEHQEDAPTQAHNASDAPESVAAPDAEIEVAAPMGGALVLSYLGAANIYKGVLDGVDYSIIIQGYGATTYVSDEELAQLESDPSFSLHAKNGFITVTPQ